MRYPRGYLFQPSRRATGANQSCSLLARVAITCPGLIVLACASQQRPLPLTAEGQSYTEAIQQICEVDRHIVGAAGANVLDLGQLREDFIVENTKNPDAIFFVTVWRTKSPVDKGSLLYQEATKQKLPECAFAKSLVQASE